MNWKQVTLNAPGVCEVAFLKAKILKMNNEFKLRLKIAKSKALLFSLMSRTNCCADDMIIADIRKTVERIIKHITEAELLLKTDTKASNQ